MAAQIPLSSLGTGRHGQRLRHILRRLTGRDIALTEDTTAVLVETLEAINARLTTLERITAANVRTQHAPPPVDP